MIKWVMREALMDLSSFGPNCLTDWVTFFCYDFSIMIHVS
jgi:hypothetical protein